MSQILEMGGLSNEQTRRGVLPHDGVFDDFETFLGGFRHALTDWLFSALKTGPYLRGDKLGSCPGASTTRGPPQKQLKNYYLRKHKNIMFHNFFI